MDILSEVYASHYTFSKSLKNSVFPMPPHFGHLDKYVVDILLKNWHSAQLPLVWSALLLAWQEWEKEDDGCVCVGGGKGGGEGGRKR